MLLCVGVCVSVCVWAMKNDDVPCEQNCQRLSKPCPFSNNNNNNTIPNGRTAEQCRSIFVAFTATWYKYIRMPAERRDLEDGGKMGCVWPIWGLFVA